jgi:acyl carrier protein
MTHGREGQALFIDVNLVMRLVAEQLHVAQSELSLDCRFVEDFAATDVELTNLMLALEEQFELQIRNDDATRLKTLADVLKYIDDAMTARTNFR